MVAWLVLISVIALLVILASGKMQPAVAFTGLAGAYLLFGWIDTSSFLIQYTNPALAALLLLLLVSLALERSPMLDWLSARLLNGSARIATTRLVVSSAVMSAFVNNTAVVAALLGTISRQKRFAPSRLLIPLSYASVLGGITTLVGTSTNLVVNSFYVNTSGESLGMFQFAWVGVPVALLTMIVLIWRSSRLPVNVAEDDRETQDYFLAARLEADSPLVGHSIEENGMRQLDGLYLMEIERDGRLISPVTPDELLLAGDTLVFTGEVDRVQVLRQFAGLTSFGDEMGGLLESNLVEAVVSHRSVLVGKTLQDVDFRSKFDAGVVGIRRGDKRLNGQLGRIELRIGDCLLLAVGGDFSQHRNLDRNFHLLDSRVTRPRLTPKQSILSIIGFATVIGLSAAEILPLFQGLVLLLGGLLATRILGIAELRRRFHFDLWLIIGSALAIAHVMSTSGAADLLANGMHGLFSDYGVYAAFIGCYLLTMIFTESVTNNAAAALAFPIAWSTAHAMGVNPIPFVMAVVYGASACFLNPFGYQTHLMVYSPGRYKLMDFVRFGLPVSVTYSVAVLVITPMVFPF